jgi:hypothetical protein
LELTAASNTVTKFFVVEGGGSSNWSFGGPRRSNVRRRDFIFGSFLAATGSVTHVACDHQSSSDSATESVHTSAGEKTVGLPLYSLGAAVDSIVAPGELVWEGPHEKAEGGYQRRYKIPEGHVILTTWKGKLHEVIYQTPADNEKASADRNVALFAHYGEGQAFNEVLDNGFGKTYRRADLLRYALWSYAMDYTTIGTMQFHAVKWR